MTDPAKNGIPRKPWKRSAGLAIFAVILLALFLWMRYEENQTELLRAPLIEANLKRKAEIDAKNRRAQAAYALVTKATATEDSAEQARIYDEIINTYQGDKTKSIQTYVSWALYKKALAVTDPIDKSRLLEEVVGRYYDMPDELVNSYVRGALRKRVNLAESGAEKIAVCDRLLEKYGPRLPDSLTALILHEKARSTSDPAEQIAVYDTILSRFLSSTDDSAFDQAIIVALDKMELIKDQAEQLRLCDIAIEAYLKTPQRTRYYLFDTAIRKKAELVDNPALPLELYNQVIANNVTEDSVVQARSMRMSLLKDDKERLAASGELIEAHQDSKSDFVRLMVARAMARKADLLTDPEAKEALFRSIIEKCANIKDTRAKDLANETIAKLAELSGDTAFAARYYDEQVAKADNELEAIRALKSKANLVKSSGEKVRLYDEIIARGGQSRDRSVSREVTSAILKKVDLTDDRTEKIKLYDEAIARRRESGDKRERARVTDLMLGKAQYLDDKEAEIRLYDEIIAENLNSGNKEDQAKAARAMLEKARAIDDREEKIKLYDTVLFDMTRIHDNIFLIFLPNVLRERVELEVDADDKARLFDRYIAAAGEELGPKTRLSLLLDKAGYTKDPADKSRLYDEVIEYCVRLLNDEENSDSLPPLEEHNKTMIMNDLGRAVFSKAGLLENSDEKLRLYDWYLAFPQTGRFVIMNIYLEKILADKAEISGDPSIQSDYFEAQIKAAATDSERVYWFSRKAGAANPAERAAIEEEMITKFFDITELGAEKTVAAAFLRKIERTSDSDEKITLCDRLIKRYGDGPDGRAPYAVVRALTIKAKALKDDDARLELYTTIIDRYKDIDDYLVKSAVDEVIAAKFRLENISGKKKSK